MKSVKFFAAALFFAAVCVACGDPNGGGGILPPPPGGDTTNVEAIPDIDKPAEGYVTFVIHVPANSECHGIAIKGSSDGSVWTNADEYLTAEGIPASEGYLKFTAIPEYENWYQATYKLGDAAFFDDAVYLAGKICLVYSGDGSWQGQATDWSYNDEYTSAKCNISGDGNIQVQGSGLIYVEVGGFQMSECEADVTYHVTVKVPECGFVDAEIIGSFDGWAGTAMTATADPHTFTVDVTTAKGAEFKFRQVGTWENEILVYDGDADTWGGMGNMKFGDEADKEGNINLDFSDPTMYKWSACEE